MVDKTLSHLDYPKLVDILFQFSATPFIGDSFHNLRPLRTREEINDRQDRIDAVLEVIKWDGRIPLGDMPDVTEVLRRCAIQDSILETEDFLLLSEFLSACNDVFLFLKKAYNKKPFIDDLLGRLRQFPELRKRLGRTVNPEGFIEDSASYELSRLRTELFSFRERIRKNLERVMEREQVRVILQDSYVAIRNNRYVIPLKPNFNEALQGIVHDYSHSLKTSFVEPVECVELNNTINILVNEEKEEEKKVLRELTEMTRDFVDDLLASVDALRDLDFHHALALFALEFHCVRPEIIDGGSLEIKGAMNPFIVLSKKQDAVPIDIVMDDSKQVMIISGPNAGGKTAALKTMGLLSVMAKAGLFIPATGRPMIPFYREVYALIGDEQDISMELSSFTAHMYAIKDLYNHARGNELVLIDEIGGATEPQEASALAMAVMDAFIEKNCKVIVTTHLNLIKAYGYTRPFAFNVSTSFDMEAVKPLYKLTYGTAGYSNAITVAKNIDVPQVIIEKSHGYLGKQEFMLNDLITNLEREKKAAEDERNQLAGLKEEARKRLAAIKENRDAYVLKVEQKCAARLAELAAEIEEIQKEVAKRDKETLNKGRRRVQVLQGGLKDKSVAPEREEIHIGDTVLVKTLGGKGRVVDIEQERDIYEVAVGSIRTKLKRFMIEKTSPEKTSRKIGQGHLEVEKQESAELNLMGMRVEEALGALDRFLDRAVVDGASKVRVLHGIGTGRLMQAVSRHLSDLPYVRAFHYDEKNSGVTIVEFA